MNPRLGDERSILEAVCSAATRILGGAEFSVVHSFEEPWSLALRVAIDGGHSRHLYWGAQQWYATMRFRSESGEPTTILEPIAAATREAEAVDLGTVIACAAAGSAALDLVADARTVDAADSAPALEQFGAAIAALERMGAHDSPLDPATRALASTLRSEWLIAGLDDTLG